MTKETATLTAVMERYGLTVKLAMISSFATLALFLMVFLTGPVYEWSGFRTYSLTLIPFGLAFLYSITAFFHAKFSEKAVKDEEEKILLQKRKNKTSILDISEDVRFTAGRALLNFERYVPAIVTVAAFLFTAAILIYLWRGSFLNTTEAIKLSSGLPKQPMTLAFICALSLTFCMLGGIFLSGQSHVIEFRWLRPVGAWLMAGGAIFILTLISALLVQAGKGHFDQLLAKIVFFAIALLAVELLINFISEFYRPRSKMETKPVYESHLLSFFTEPGGVMRNLADSLDYQFGFKVSKTWIYGFISRALLPALLGWAFLFWISTIVVEVRPGEVGLRSRLGAVINKRAPLEPGVYLKLPYPLENIITVNIEAINSIFLGARFEKDGQEIKPGVLLWTNEHGKGSAKGYLVANDSKGTKEDMAKAVSILEVNLLVNYKVRKPQAYEYLFNFENIKALISDISTKEATKYFASTDFMKDLSSARTDIMNDLRKRIQADLDAQNAGVEVTNVNMNGAHPPVKEVVPAFQDVLAAKEEAKKLIYEAQGVAAKTLAEGDINALKIISTAQADSFGVRTEAEADAFRFQRQLNAYKQQPALFKLRTYLDFLENDCKDLRKLIISSGIPSQIFELNLEETARLDLLNSGEVSKFGK